MARKGEENRQRIISAADSLFHQKGYNQTSFAEVAEASGIPKGNFYYYFKSKDDLLDAVLAMRREYILDKLKEYEAEFPDPKGRLKRMARIPLTELDSVLRFGCPLGSLSAELGKTQRAQMQGLGELFALYIDWGAEQFRQLGHGQNSREQALHLLAWIQGIILLSAVYADADFLAREIHQVEAWVDALPA